MKIKNWPLLAIVLFLGALVTQKYLVARIDYIDSVNTTESVIDPAPTSIGMVQVVPEAARPVLVQAQVQTDPEPAQVNTDMPVSPEEDDVGWLTYVKNNLVTIVSSLIALLEIIVRLTPTERDNSLLSAIKAIIDKFIPNRRTGGGTL